MSLYVRWVDTCSPTRHFFARLKLCQHEGKYVKRKHMVKLSRIFNEEFGKAVQEEVDQAYRDCHPFPKIFNVLKK